MATEILRPQDVLVNRFRVHTTSYSRRRNFPVKPTPPPEKQQRRPSTKHEKKRSDIAAADEAKKPNHGGDRRRRGEIGGCDGLAMGQVTLLRRGESLDSFATKLEDSNPRDLIVEDAASVRARSDSELVVPRRIRKAPPPSMVDIYAGAGFESSPSPRCLPRPTFINNMKGGSEELFEDGATRYLRRMLRLD